MILQFPIAEENGTSMSYKCMYVSVVLFATMVLCGIKIHQGKTTEKKLEIPQTVEPTCEHKSTMLVS